MAKMIAFAVVACCLLLTRLASPSRLDHPAETAPEKQWMRDICEGTPVDNDSHLFGWKLE